MKTLTPPHYPKRPKKFSEFGIERDDPYYWLREKNNPEVRALIDAENNYLDQILEPLKPKLDEYFEELKGLLEPDAIQVSYPLGKHLYGSKIPDGKEYAIHFRKKSASSSEEILLDLNTWAEGHDYTDLGAFSISDDEDALLFSLDRDGSEHYTVYFKDLVSGKISNTTLSDTAGETVWSQSGKSVFYTLLDDKDRPNRVFRHKIGTDPKTDELLYEEKDPRFFVSIDRSKDGNWLIIDTGTGEASETWLQKANDTDTPKLVIPRREKIRTSLLAHGDHLIALSNHEERNYGLYEITHVGDSIEKWKRLWIGDSNIDIRGIDDYQSGYVVEYGNQGKVEYRFFDWNHQKVSDFKVPGECYRVGFGDNAKVDLDSCRLDWSAPNHPGAVLEFNLLTGTPKTIYERKAPLLNPDEFEVKMEFAQSHDGVKIPYSVLSLRNSKSPLPTVLVGYGAYGMPYPDGYRAWSAQLVRRGFRVALAHIRGGGCLGQRWYEDGKYEKKINSFLDFNACSEDLIQKGYSKVKEISIWGGSAGGMLVGAAMNLRPDLYRSVFAFVPFLDVLNTMLDETLPLTPLEFDEWGNPKERKYFDAIRAYSPYDNLRETDYPHVYLSAGWSDPRVTYWEPLKFCAKLRELRTNKTAYTLLRTVVEGGHGGLSGRYQALKELAEQNVLLSFFHKQK